MGAFFVFFGALLVHSGTERGPRGLPPHVHLFFCDVMLQQESGTWHTLGEHVVVFEHIWKAAGGVNAKDVR